jgi:hypothetical protein
MDEGVNPSLKKPKVSDDMDEYPAQTGLPLQNALPMNPFVRNEMA